LVAKVGDDLFGRQAVEGFQKEGIVTDYIVADPQHHTGVALILVDDEGENLISVASALDNVMLPMTFAGMPQTDAQDKAVEILKKVGLGERILHKPLEMSGGQQQRVACARALANDPAIVLADEPTANLDRTTGEQIIDLLSEINADDGVTIITATHDHKMLSASDRIAWVRDGRIERIQERDEIEIKEGAMHVH
jgi:putative ABC transport system ATP-binding protein